MPWWGWLILLIVIGNIVNMFVNSSDEELEPNTKQKSKVKNEGYVVKTSYDSDSSIVDDDQDKWDQEYPEPMPADDRKTITMLGHTYYLAWTGRAAESELSINRKERVTVIPTHILVKDLSIYIAVLDNDMPRVIKGTDISSQIQMKGHGLNSFMQWIRKISPNLPWNFDYAYTLKETYPNDYIEIWKGKAAPTTFTAMYSNGTDRLTVTPIGLYKGKITDDLYLDVTLPTGKTERLHSKEIKTMLATEGQKKAHLSDWARTVLGVGEVFV